MGELGRHPDPNLGLLGALVDGLGAILGDVGLVSEGSWAVWGPSWAVLGRSGEGSGEVWGCLRVFLPNKKGHSATKKR